MLQCPICGAQREDSAWFCERDQAPLAFGADHRLLPQHRAGQGAVGQVFKCLRRGQPHLRPVAVKVLGMTDNSRDQQRLRREATALDDLRHDHIVRFIDFGDVPQLWVAMEWIEGETLESVIERGRLALERVVLIGLQVARALKYIHSKGKLHRDIKPGNLMISERDHVTLVDFGVVKLPDEPALTVEGAGPGTPGYQALEAMHGAATARSDIFSLGQTLWHAATGLAPSADGWPKHTLPAHLRNLLTRMTEAKESRRPTIDEVIAGLEQRDLLDLPAGTVDPASAPVRDTTELAMPFDGADAEKADTNQADIEQADTTELRPRRPLPKVALSFGLVVLLGLALWAFARPRQPLDAMWGRYATAEDLAVEDILLGGKEPGEALVRGQHLDGCYGLPLSTAFGLSQCKDLVCAHTQSKGTHPGRDGRFVQSGDQRLPLLVYCREE